VLGVLGNIYEDFLHVDNEHYVAKPHLVCDFTHIRAPMRIHGQSGSRETPLALVLPGKSPMVRFGK
jgi:hypothetical protein